LSKVSQIRQKAQEYLSKGQTDKAIQEYRRLISIESKNPNLYNELGDIFLRSNDKAQAVQNYEKAAVIYEKVALYNNAVAVCKKILRIEPEKIDTIFKLSELRAKQKLTGEAVTFFSQYVEIVLENPESMLMRSQKDVDLMIELMPASEPILAKAVEIYESIGLKLKTVMLYAKLASIASDNEDEKKHAQYQRKIDDLKQDLPPDEMQKLNGAIGESSDGAASKVAAGVSDKPAEGVPEVGAAGTERLAGDPGAASNASPAEDQSPAAEAIEEESGPEESNEHEIDYTVQKAVEEAEIVAAMSRGGIQTASGAYGERMKREVAEGPSQVHAATVTETPMERFPGDKVSAPADVGPPMRDAGEHEGNLVEEITSDVEMNDLRSHYDLGMAYLEMGLYTEAIKDFQIASRCADLQLSSMEMIGYCFLKHGQPRLAVKQLSHALEIAKASGAENLGIHYNLGLAHEMLGELPTAREHFEEVYIVDMSFRDVADKMKKLSTVS
jgi:tetratricopeptide (TPR) repeat protein